MHRDIPDFLVIGAAKSGTTYLCNLLGQHPQVFMCDPKEPRYFGLPREEYEKKWGWYRSLFADIPDTVVAAGEGSQSYTCRPLDEG